MNLIPEQKDNWKKALVLLGLPINVVNSLSDTMLENIISNLQKQTNIVHRAYNIFYEACKKEEYDVSNT